MERMAVDLSILSVLVGNLVPQVTAPNSPTCESLSTQVKRKAEFASIASKYIQYPTFDILPTF